MMYQMGVYCRLSKDDGENKVSESIENQMKLIREYVTKSEDLEIADIYIDDGYSGLYFANRPEFQRMMEDIYKGKIQGVITKDISRLGREHIETSNYIERVFPSLGVRYIAILDGVDSVHHSNEELAQFKTLFNDMYSRDISKKIRGALTAQKKRGQFMSGFAPYGYVKDPADKAEYEKQDKDIRAKIQLAEQEKDSFGEAEESYENWIEKFIKYGTLSEVTREIVTELIEKIVVNGDKSIDIVFKYQSPYPVEKQAV